MSSKQGDFLLKNKLKTILMNVEPPSNKTNVFTKANLQFMIDKIVQQITNIRVNTFSFILDLALEETGTELKTRINSGKLLNCN